VCFFRFVWFEAGVTSVTSWQTKVGRDHEELPFILLEVSVERTRKEWFRIRIDRFTTVTYGAWTAGLGMANKSAEAQLADSEIEANVTL